LKDRGWIGTQHLTRNTTHIILRVLSDFLVLYNICQKVAFLVGIIEKNFKLGNYFFTAIYLISNKHIFKINFKE